MNTENRSTLSLDVDEIIILRSSIRARIREFNRMLKHCQDLPGVEDDKAILETIYEKLGREQDKF